MAYSRYSYARQLAAGARVLEIGCGSGIGLGLVAERSHLAVGGDIEFQPLFLGRSHYGSRVSFVVLSAEQLPFPNGFFDLVLFFETSYYVRDMEKAFDEIARVLSNRGAVVFVNANPERPDFIRSPHSVHYHSAAEFRCALERRGYGVRVEGAFPLASGTASGWMVQLARQILQRLRLVPRTLRGRAILKRLVYGRLRQLPPELKEGFGTECTRYDLPEHPVERFKVLYVTGERDHARSA